jgi:hypothetical protein
MCPKKRTINKFNGLREWVRDVRYMVTSAVVKRLCYLQNYFPIGGFSPPEGRLACGCKPPAFSRFLFQLAVKSAESF